MEITGLIEKCHKNALEKGWWDEVVDGKVIPRSLGDQFANFHSELSEAWEEVRAGHAMNEFYFNEGKPEGVPVELADCLIRIFDTCGRYGIDLEFAIELKMAYNRTRPYRHGGKTA